MQTIEKTSVERLVVIGFGLSLAVLLVVSGIAISIVSQFSVEARAIEIGILALLALLTVLYAKARQGMRPHQAVEHARQEIQGIC